MNKIYDNIICAHELSYGIRRIAFKIKSTFEKPKGEMGTFHIFKARWFLTRAR